MDNTYSLYCIEQCPIGKKKSDEYLSQNNSALDAAIDMQIFVNRCDCKYEKERREFDKKEHKL